MLDHYYTPRDAPAPQDLPRPIAYDPTYDAVQGKPRPPRAAIVDLSTLDLEHLAFDCDSGSESGSDDGYVSTLQRMQRAMPAPVPVTPRRIAGARRVARAVSTPQPVREGMGVMEVEVEGVEAVRTGTEARARRRAPEGEVFQSITAIPGLECTSFEELRLETYLQSLIATGTARPQPAFAPALVIPPAFSPPFCEWDTHAASGDVEMPPAPAPTTSTVSTPTAPAPLVSIFRAASFPPAAHPHAHPLG
ncbi:hypothetical protein DFH09DRAFT_1405742 [Mycena vulgaris]|nr:hypothetical protein DFH09DRAFT_1405742 [Mycena vulgaris]